MISHLKINIILYVDRLRPDPVRSMGNLSSLV